MGRTLFALAVCAISVGVSTSAPAAPPNQPVAATNITPLILEKDEGERRVWRPIEGAKGWDAEPGPFVLKVDRHNGGSSHLVFGTEDLPPGASIDRHKHPGADEIILLQNGRARVSLGDTTREVHGGATVFIPANTWISVTNIGTEAINCVFVFSALGFDDYMRAESAPEGQKITPLTKVEDAQIMKEHADAVIYGQP
jgi:quercetin dioxygenase-like cupin family protein